MPDLSKWGPATVLVVAISLIFAVGGLVVVIVQPATLNFAQYLEDLKWFLGSVAVLGVGRGIHLGLSSASVLPSNEEELSELPETAIKPDA